MKLLASEVGRLDFSGNTSRSQIYQFNLDVSQTGYVFNVFVDLFCMYVLYVCVPIHWSLYSPFFFQDLQLLKSASVDAPFHEPIVIKSNSPASYHIILLRIWHMPHLLWLKAAFLILWQFQLFPRTIDTKQMLKQNWCDWATERMDGKGESQTDSLK